MYKNLRWKLLTIVAVFVAFFAVGVYPLLAARYHLPIPSWLKAYELKLGLDLKGGVQLHMRVNTDDALRITTTSVSEQLRYSLATSGITATINPTSPSSFRVEGIPQDKDSVFRAAADEIAGTQYDRNPLPGGSYEFRMKPNIDRDLREQAVDQTMQTIDRRVNELGVTEPSIARQSGGDELLIQLPGVTDIAHAKEIIGKTAQLEFKLVEAGPNSSKEELLKQYNGQLPGDMEILPGSSERGGGGEPVYYIVRKIAPVTGQDLRSAKPGLDENNAPAVLFELKSQGATKFGKLSGVNAIIALVTNLVILIGLMAYLGATMTLPGIAGFVLTMGVGVDSNVLIFERIKEELAAQRGVRAAINAGFSRVFLTLLDTHIASLIAALFLFQFGTGPIRGFATTLSVGLFVNLFTSIFVSKTLFELELSRRQTPALSI